MSYGYCCHRVVDVYVDRCAEFDVCYGSVGRHKVEKEVSVFVANIACMIVALFGAAIAENFHSVVDPWDELHACVHKQKSTRIDKRCEMGKTFKIVFFISVNVEVVGVG